MNVVATGLDYRRYAKFSMLVPDVVRTYDGTQYVHPAKGLTLGQMNSTSAISSLCMRRST
jgi:hypothetical protein